MSPSAEAQTLEPALQAARALVQGQRWPEAQAAFAALAQGHPDCVEAWIWAARLAGQRGDIPAMRAMLDHGVRANAGHEGLAIEQAVARAGAGDLGDAISGLRLHLSRAPDSPAAWLLLAEMLDDSGDALGTLLAQFEATHRAYRAGHWLAAAKTPPHMADAVGRAMRAVQRGRREIFFHALSELRSAHGDAALARIDRALTGYLMDWDSTPPDPMQRPRFFNIPDLPATPYFDPTLQPWAPRLRRAFVDMRAEALALLPEQAVLEDFVKVGDGEQLGKYLGGDQPAWEAFFFYRHGKRYDDNHRRCPRTSAVLENLDLCRIPGMTPEVCFSVLAPGTRILPHHGVTNARVVMHLPLVVPERCALNLVDRGTHHWREGELMMFDDTFLHEAWNESATPRIILLMDCWNPHLTLVEREAFSLLSTTIGAVDVELKAADWPM